MQHLCGVANMIVSPEEALSPEGFDSEKHFTDHIRQTIELDWTQTHSFF